MDLNQFTHFPYVVIVDSQLRPLPNCYGDDDDHFEEGVFTS